jgi:hypothetical protein
MRIDICIWKQSLQRYGKICQNDFPLKSASNFNVRYKNGEGDPDDAVRDFGE